MFVNQHVSCAFIFIQAISWPLVFFFLALSEYVAGQDRRCYLCVLLNISVRHVARVKRSEKENKGKAKTTHKGLGE